MIQKIFKGVVNLSLIACLTIGPIAAVAQVIPDNNGVGDGTTTSGAGPFPQTLTTRNFSVPPGYDKLLVVITRTRLSSIASLTFGTQNMTRLENPVTSSGSFAEIWYLPLGGLYLPVTKDITATLTGNASPYTAFTAATFSGVDQSTPMNNLTSNTFTSATSGNTSSSLSIAGGIGDQAVEGISSLGVVAQAYVVHTPASNQNVLTTCFSINTTRLRETMAQKAQTGLTQALNWSISNSMGAPSGIQIAANIRQSTTALPIKLVRFTAQKITGSRNLINWSTATEYPATVFSVERSADGASFSPIGVQQGKGGNNEYAIYDEHAPPARPTTA